MISNIFYKFMAISHLTTADRLSKSHVNKMNLIRAFSCFRDYIYIFIYENVYICKHRTKTNKDFFSKCDQVHRKLLIWSHLLKNSLIQDFTFCAVELICENIYICIYIYIYPYICINNIHIHISGKMDLKVEGLWTAKSIGGNHGCLIRKIFEF